MKLRRNRGIAGGGSRGARRDLGRSDPGSVEGVRLGFEEDAKTEKESLRIALDAALCLANTVGGTVVFGLDDDVAGSASFVGTTLDAARVKKYIYDNSRPRLLVRAAEDRYHDCRLLALDTHADHDIYSDTKGRAPHRIGTDCAGMDPATQQRLRESAEGLTPLGCRRRGTRSTRQPGCWKLGVDWPGWMEPSLSTSTGSRQEQSHARWSASPVPRSHRQRLDSPGLPAGGPGGRRAFALRARGHLTWPVGCRGYGQEHPHASLETAEPCVDGCRTDAATG